MNYHYQVIDSEVWVQVRENNLLVWPVDKDEYGKVKDCPRSFRKDIYHSLQQFETCMREDLVVLVKCIEEAEKLGYV